MLSVRAGGVLRKDTASVNICTQATFANTRLVRYHRLSQTAALTTVCHTLYNQVRSIVLNQTKQAYT